MVCRHRSTRCEVARPCRLREFLQQCALRIYQPKSRCAAFYENYSTGKCSGKREREDTALLARLSLNKKSEGTARLPHNDTETVGYRSATCSAKMSFASSFNASRVSCTS